MSSASASAFRDFFSKVSETLLTRVLVMGIALIVSVIIARVLGPAGQGLYASAIALGAITVQFGSLGLGTSNTYLSAKSPQLLSQLLGNSLSVALICGIVVYLTLYAVQFIDPSFIPLSGSLFTMVAFWVFPGLIYHYCQSLILGLQKIRFYNILDIGYRVSHVFLLGLMIFFGFKSVESFYFIFLLAIILVATFSVVASFIYADAKFPIPSMKLFRSSALYGFSAYTAGLFSFLCLRFDLLMLGSMRDAKEAGFYSIAVSLADVLYTLPVVMGMILFAKLSSMSDFEKKRQFVFKIIGLLMGVMLVGLVLAYFLVGLLIPLLYGEEYIPSVLPFQILLPGIMFLSLSTIVQNFLASTGRSWPMCIGPAIALICNFVLNYLWIPLLGKEGAAWASSVSYGLWFIVGMIILWKLRPKKQKDFNEDFAPKDYILSVYSLTSEVKKEVEEQITQKLDVIEISTLVRELGIKRILFYLLNKNIDRLYFYSPEEGGSSLTEIVCGFSLVANARELIILKGNDRLVLNRKGMLKAVFRVISSSLYGRKLIKRKEKELERLLQKDRIPAQGGLKGSVLFLKANLWFGVKAGGSVGHVAGVINAFIRRGMRVNAASISKPLMVDEKVHYHPLPYERTFGYPVEINNYIYGEDINENLLNSSIENNVDFIYQRLSLGNDTGVHLSRKWKKPLILEYNGSEVWVSSNWGKQLKYHNLADLCERVCLKHAHLIVTVSDVLKDELVSKGIEEERIVSYPNCIDPNIFSPDKVSDQQVDEIKDLHNLNDNDFIVTFIGTFGKWHGIRVLADCIEKQVRESRDLLDKHNVKFLLVGDGSEMPYIQQKLATKNCLPYVRFTGLVEQHMAPIYLKASSVLVSPHVPNEDGSRFFGSPTKLFEYMAMEKPIVASDLEQLSDIFSGSIQMKDGLSTSDLQKSSALLVRPGDVDHFSKALIFLYENKEASVPLSVNARRLALEKYTWDIHVEKIVDAFDREFKE